ncbi:3-oxoacyl-[acyl-carrier protein] reductase [Microcella alkaliphila]|uniref:3-oxoacyl-[acyl-carrier protein] reductase n=1 Tax=Microcella alkaliphila TaxID=279828 RepID=A0A4Q7TZ02_9MICO|nr:glucose 1-dehydrogenase [Microcella alkaliphila]RZT66411.1 3-oxoacyl-[acyl-carrier protein] reductase [Microcella alkaliphila]
MSTKQRVVVVTGGGQGIGREYAIAFAARGDAVVIADLNSENAESVHREIQDQGGTSLAVVTNVADKASVDAMVQKTADRFGTVDVLINNAAIFSALKMKPFEEISPDEWEKVFAVNSRGVFLCAQAVAPYMKKQRSGRIVNISSSVVTTGRANYAHYVASKGAVSALNKSLATELGEYNITSNVVSPHGIVTEIPRETITDDQWAGMLAEQAIKRKGTPQDVVAAVVFLASEEAGYITGQTLLIDGGLRYT